MFIAIKKLSYKLIFVLALFEAVSLFFIALFGIDTTTKTDLTFKFINGLFTGFLTTIIAITIINLLLKNIQHKIRYQEQRVTKLGILTPAILNAIFLAVLFVIESIVSPIKHVNLIFGNAIVGVITTPLSIYLTLALYNRQDKLKIYFKTTKKHFIKKFSAGNIAIYAGTYEVIALPIMAVLMQQSMLQSQLGFTIIGLLAGLSSMITVFLYNRMPQKRKIWLETS